MRISILAAKSSNNVIGVRNQLPWHIPAELKHFKTLTMGHHIIMGRKTFESIGRALPGRDSIVVSRNIDYQAPGCMVANSIDAAINTISNDDEIFIIGGAELIHQTVPRAARMYLTEIHKDYAGDVYFPELDWSVWQEIERKPQDDKTLGLKYDFVIYDKK